LEQLQTASEADRWWSVQFFVDLVTGQLVGSGGYVAPPSERTDDHEDSATGVAGAWRWTRLLNA